MTITLTPDIEDALTEQARQRGVTPEHLALESLRTLYAPAPIHDTSRRQAALAVIQSGKFARPLAPDEPLASNAFAARKAEEKAREDRRERT